MVEHAEVLRRGGGDCGRVSVHDAPEADSLGDRSASCAGRFSAPAHRGSDVRDGSSLRFCDSYRVPRRSAHHHCGPCGSVGGSLLHADEPALAKPFEGPRGRVDGTIQDNQPSAIAYTSQS